MANSASVCSVIGTGQNGTFACPDTRDYTITASSVTRYCFDLSDWESSGWTLSITSRRYALNAFVVSL